MADSSEDEDEYSGRIAILLEDDVPSSIQQDLCGILTWDLKLDQLPQASDAAGSERPNSAGGQDNRSKKKHKSQRRMEKEQEYYERQRRMQENQKARTDALKKTVCKFFQQGKCRDGVNCRFGHF